MKKNVCVRAYAQKVSWTMALASAMFFTACTSSNFGGSTGTKPVDKPAPATKPDPVVTTTPSPSTADSTPVQVPVQQTPVIVQQPITPTPQPIVVPISPPVVTPVAQQQQPPVTQVTPQIATPVSSGAAVRVPIIGIINMDSKYQITNEGYRVSVEDEAGKVLAAGPLNIQAVMDGEAFDAPGSAYGKPYLLTVKPQYLAAEISSGQLQGARKAKVSICMPENLNQAWNESIQCRDLNKYVGHSNGSNTFVRLSSDINIQNDQVGITAIHNARSKGDCGTSKIPCASVMHPIFGFAAESGAFRNDNASPLVLDLNKNGKIDLLSAWRKGGPVQFDLAGDGEKIRMGWVAAGDGLLAYDINKNGVIDSGRELFGESTERVQRDEVNGKFTNGFLALAQFDRNHDGVIDVHDPIFNDLVIWQDRNADGISQSGELMSLAKAGVVSLNLRYQTVSRADQPNVVAGNDIKLMSSYTATDGKAYKLADVWFEMRLYKTISQIIGLNK